MLALSSQFLPAELMVASNAEALGVVFSMGVRALGDFHNGLLSFRVLLSPILLKYFDKRFRVNSFHRSTVLYLGHFSSNS